MDNDKKDILKNSSEISETTAASETSATAEPREICSDSVENSVKEEAERNLDSKNDQTAESDNGTVTSESSERESNFAVENPDKGEADRAQTVVTEPAELLLDESPIIVTEVPSKRKKFLKPWSELTKKERVNRVLAVVMAIALIAIVTFTTVWCCVIADRAYNTPQWKTEREVYRNNVEKTLEDLGSGLKVAEEKFGENPRWFIVAKKPYDMRNRLFPENKNVAGYRYMFLETFRETNDSIVVTWNINGYVENFNGVDSIKPVLTDSDGAFVELSFWDFEARETMFPTSGEDGILYANYKMSAVINGNLYTVSAQRQSPDGTFGQTLTDWIKLYAKSVMTHLSDINH